jgi:NTE family protein
MVGASCAAGKLAELKAWVLESTRTDVLRFFDFPPARGGLVDRERFDEFLHGFVAPADVDIESLDTGFLAVATDLDSGREVWLREGSLAHAVKASMAMPGLFPAVRHDGRWLVDGGLVDPVPVSACRALGADVVIGVNLNADILGKRRRKVQAPASDGDDGVLGNLKKQARQYSSTLFSGNGDEDAPPGLFYSIPTAINIFQDRITRSRLVGDPADILLAPRVGHIGILEFQRAGEAMEIGRACVEQALDDIRRAVAS